MKIPTKRYHPRLTFALGALLASVPMGYAAGEAAAPERRERMEQGAVRLAEELGLNDDQKTKWKALAEQEKSEMQALRDNPGANQEDRRAKAAAIHKKYRDQRQAILTPEQRTKADKLRDRFEERREKRQDKDGEKPAAK